MILKGDEDDIGSLERSREALYRPTAPAYARDPFAMERKRELPHAWEEEKEAPSVPHNAERHVRLASIFFGMATLFFFVAISIAGYFLYYGGNSVSIDKVTLDIQGPTTIAGGDTVPLSITVTNNNPTALENATIEIDFPTGTRDAVDVLKAYPRYIENLGTLASGQTVTRSVRAIIFGGTSDALALPILFSYSTSGSNAVFQKKISYAVMISSTPLSLSVETLSETVAGEPLTFLLTVRSNAAVPLSNVVLAMGSPFGFTITSSSLPLDNNASFRIGTLAPGASVPLTLTGSLVGQNNEQRVFHFTVGTAKSSQDSTLAVSYMTQAATVSIAAPFITTRLALNGDTSDTAVLNPGSTQDVSVSYTNTLSTPITNATVAITINGSAIDYGSIKAMSGFYNSATHTIIFDQSTDSALASLAPGSSGVGSFNFSTIPAGSNSPAVSFIVAVSGTRVGQANVPEQVTVSTTKTAKVVTTVLLSAISAHTGTPLAASGPIPPRADQATTYSIVWNVEDKGSTVAGGTVTASLPTYVSYTGQTAGTGTFVYDPAARVVKWNVGDLSQGATAQGIFQVSITPSTSQRGSAPDLTTSPSFSGYDRFAGANVSASGRVVTTDTPYVPGYVAGNGIVQ